jgi:hypothetical protein
MTAQESKPAGRNPWPIFIVVYFIVFIGYIATYVTFAERQRMDLVREDYYDQEIKFQRQIDGARRAQSSSTPVAVHYDSSAALVTVALPKEQVGRNPTGSVIFYRPSDARLDEQRPLAVDDSGVQRLDVKALHAGPWKVRVEWKVDDQDYYSEQPFIIRSKVN